MEKYEALLDGTYELPEALYTGLGDLKRVAYSSAMEVFLPATSEEREENGGDATGRWHDLAFFIPRPSIIQIWFWPTLAHINPRILYIRL